MLQKVINYLPHLTQPAAAAGPTPRSNVTRQVLQRTVNAMLPLFNDDSDRIPASIRDLALALYCSSQSMLTYSSYEDKDTSGKVMASLKGVDFRKKFIQLGTLGLAMTPNADVRMEPPRPKKKKPYSVIDEQPSAKHPFGSAMRFKFMEGRAAAEPSGSNNAASTKSREKYLADRALKSSETLMDFWGAFGWGYGRAVRRAQGGRGHWARDHHYACETRATKFSSLYWGHSSMVVTLADCGPSRSPQNCVTASVVPLPREGGRPERL